VRIPVGCGVAAGWCGYVAAVVRTGAGIRRSSMASNWVTDVDLANGRQTSRGRAGVAVDRCSDRSVVRRRDGHTSTMKTVYRHWRQTGRP